MFSAADRAPPHRSRCARRGVDLDQQHALDTEDNELQQDSVTLQGLLSKRDSAFSTASNIVKKADRTNSSTISNFA